MELVKSLVLDAAGVGVLPYRVAAHGVAEGRLRPLSRDLPGFDDRITLVWRADAPMTAGLRTVLDDLLAHGRAMPALPRGVG
jgi:DNA-binding transcriptional LysR family regulator